MAETRRCGLCNINWPDLHAYDRCAKCDEPTSRLTDPDVLSASGAQSLRKEIEFDKFYAERGPREVYNSKDGSEADDMHLAIARAQVQHALELAWQLAAQYGIRIV